MSDEPKPLADWLRTEALYLYGNPDWTGPLTTPSLLNDAAEELDRLNTFETAVRSVLKAVNEYLPPDSGKSKDWLIGEVIGAVDNPRVFRALNGTSEPSNAIVDEGMGEGK